MVHIISMNTLFLCVIVKSLRESENNKAFKSSVFVKTFVTSIV